MSMTGGVTANPTAVGVVLPVCDGARTIGAAIRSVQAQSFPHWRLYVVIDRSADDTVGIVRDIASTDDRITPIENPERRGLPHALLPSYE